jgi:phosphoserine phosphatase
MQRVVNLHAVGIDDFAIMLLRKRDGQSGLAAGGRPGYQDRIHSSSQGSSMALVATLVANPSHPLLVPMLAEKAVKAISASGLYWLADGIACDLPIRDGMTASEAEVLLREAMSGQAIDVVVQEAETRRKKLLLADMDSTMIGQECIDELAAEVGLKDKVAAITARAMNGEIAFEPALRERVALLKGLPISVADDVIAKRITLTPGGLELVATMKSKGYYAALVSGGFTVFTGPVAAKIGFDENRANILVAEDGILTGEVVEPILGKQAKVDALIDLARKLDISPEDVMAVGDGANDLGMIKLAGAGVALHAKPVVAAEAKIRIDHGDLTALLYIQGYRKSDFVNGLSSSNL